jgi:hypothetical protein
MGVLFSNDRALYNQLISDRKKYGKTVRPSIISLVKHKFHEDFGIYIVGEKTDYMVRTGMDIFTYKYPKHAVRYENVTEGDMTDAIEEVLLDMFEVSCKIIEKDYFVKIILTIRVPEDVENICLLP